LAALRDDDATLLGLVGEFFLFIATTAFVDPNAAVRDETINAATRCICASVRADAVCTRAG
jgi:hypothetical protein